MTTSCPRQAWCIFVRSPYAHAKINGIDTGAAKAAPGVVAVYTAEEYVADGIAMPKANMPRKKRDGSPMFAPQRPALMGDRVRYVGDSVAMVIAVTLAVAKDAAELVMVDYEALPSVTDVAEAATPGSAVVWEENGDNISHTFERGDKAATDAAFAMAKHIIRRRYTITRVHAQFMEPRGSLGVFDKFEDRYTLYADVNYPHRVRNMLAANVFKVPESQVRVVVNDVGGGFGTKGWQYVDHRLVLWAAKKLERPVKWRCERSEVIMADEHGRDNVGDIELALDENYKFLGVRLNMLASVGAYIASDRQLLTPFGQILITITGVYHVPAVPRDDRRGHFRTPTQPRPIAAPGGRKRSICWNWVIEAAADELGIDRIELRKRNVIQPEQMPYKAPLGQTYDSGTFARNMDIAMEAMDYAGFPARREASRARGKMRGASRW